MNIVDFFIDSPINSKNKASEERKGVILDVGYDGRESKAFLRIYNSLTNKLEKWYDTTGHLPYLLSDLTIEDIQKNHSDILKHPGFLRMESIQKIDLLQDKAITMTKIIAKDPLAIGGTKTSIRTLIKEHSWEDFIRYHKCFSYDRNIVFGMPYKIIKDLILPNFSGISEDIQKPILRLFENESHRFKDLVKRFLEYFLCPIPFIKRIGFDIEVHTIENRIPDAELAEEPIIAIGFKGTNDFQRIFILKRNIDIGEEIPDFNVKYEIFETEKLMIEKTFDILNQFPLILTFNGDIFDCKYMYHRAKKLGISLESIPISIITSIDGKDIVRFDNSIHIDFYRFFGNNAIKGYAFGGSYKDISLKSVSDALLKITKIPIKKWIDKLSLNELAFYCFRDAELTFDFSTFNNNLVMYLIIILMRITQMPIEDITRQGISAWIQTLFYAEHRSKGYLIPNPDQLKKMGGISTTHAIIKGKKFKGAMVVKPEAGVVFDVVVVDFSSLYPSIIKTWNLSYETINNCDHDECKMNRIPETKYWVCKKKIGLMSLIIGVLRDLRVKYFKEKSKEKGLSEEEKFLYQVINQSMKVVINASYGVFGSENFPLFCLPLAESTTAIGRYAIQKTIDKCESLGISVVYGDTDSAFLKNPTTDQLNTLIEWSNNEIGIELDADKIYRYLALSDRKKNYLGVYPDGKVDIKGLTGKKIHIPPFIQKPFKEMITELSKVMKEEDFELAKEKISKIGKDVFKRLEKRDFKIEEMAYRVKLSKALNKYTVKAQHAKAGLMLQQQLKRDIKSGDIIYFVKAKNEEGVLPVELANIQNVDIKPYKEQVKSTFEQVLDALGVDIEELMKGKTRKIDQFLN